MKPGAISFIFSFLLYAEKKTGITKLKLEREENDNKTSRN